MGFWSDSIDQQFEKLNCGKEGLDDSEALKRRTLYGFNRLGKGSSSSRMKLFFSQFKSPITILLFCAAILSYFLHDPTDASIIMAIVIISGLLGFWQEKGADNAVRKLLSMVQIKSDVLRNNQWKELPVEEIVPGDIIRVRAGDAIPADSLIISSNELFTDEAAFTGETFPVEKKAGSVMEDCPLAKRSNTLFMGSHVTSGSAIALVVLTAAETEFGKISGRLNLKAPETDFERGIRKLGLLLMQITATLVLLILFVNLLLHRPVLDSFLFALALAVGLTPQLLPAIISINLAKGAQQMAGMQVIVKRLSSIENFGSMNILCSDKTGTLTEGTVRLNIAADPDGNASSRVLFLASINSCLQQGYKNPIDDAIVAAAPAEVKQVQRIDEIPYDFIRKRLSIMAVIDHENILIVKGAFNEVLQLCSAVELSSNNSSPIGSIKANLVRKYETFSAEGFRTLAVAYKKVPGLTSISKSDESDLIFVGYITLFDPVKADASLIINQLNSLGVNIKVITGDNSRIALHMAKELGIDSPVIVTGKDIMLMSTDALVQRAPSVHLFAEVEPSQKEQIILALKKSGNVVGYMGDGINDATALHAADVGISVNSAVDVAKEAADIVLMNKNLSVVIDGIKEGRKVFLNTMKYIFMATSANFGNMFSMAGASLLLPFLPLLPKQILVMNLLTDFPEMTIATDKVDQMSTLKPRRWSTTFIVRFMLVFGLLSSIFDYFTFGVLVWFLKADEHQFQTGWFLESVTSASLIVLVLRTRLSIIRSRPSGLLSIATLSIVLFTLLLPVFPFAAWLGFTALPLSFYAVMLSIVVLYVVSAEGVKHFFYRSTLGQNDD